MNGGHGDTVTVYDAEGNELREGAAVLFFTEELTIRRIETTPSGTFVVLNTATPGYTPAYEVPSDMRCPDLYQLNDHERGDRNG